jgi:sulfofructose kinase
MTAAEPARVVCIGIATLDAIVVVDRLPGSDERIPAGDSSLAGGGVAATAAVALARLGVAVSFIGRVGDDRTGRWIRDDLAAEGVEVGGLRLVPGARSPLSSVLVERSTGARAIAPDLGDAGPIALGPDDLERCRTAAWIHLDLRGASVAGQLAAAGLATPISLDDGVADSPIPPLEQIALYAPTVAALLARAPGRDLESAMTDAAARGPNLVVVTRGGDGALALDRTGDASRWTATRPPDVAVRSTLGAGDVFHGALLAGLVEGRATAEALDRATVCATLACRGLDGRSAIPTRAELEAACSCRRPPIPTTAPTGGSIDVPA